MDYRNLPIIYPYYFLFKYRRCAMTDLWPDDIGTDLDSIETPLAILRQQANFLSQRTRNIIVGQVRTNLKGASQNNDKFKYSFRICAPILDNYTHELFNLAHDVIIYPLELFPEEPLIDQIEKSLVLNEETSIDIIEDERDFHKTIGFTIGSSASFEFALATIFAAQRTRQIIESLIAQSRAIEVPKPKAPQPEEPKTVDYDEDLPF